MRDNPLVVLNAIGDALRTAELAYQCAKGDAVKVYSGVIEHLLEAKSMLYTMLPPLTPLEAASVSPAA